MILSSLYHKLNRIATKTGIITLFLLAHLVLLLMMVFTFPRINAQLGTKAFDLSSFGYSLEEATVDFYIFPQLFLLDIFYPILLALLLSTLIIRLVNLIWKSPKHIYSNLYLIPFIAMGSDYLENSLIYVMITNPTEISSAVVKSASTFTQLKGAFTTISWVVILILFVVWLYKKWSSKNGLPIKTEL